jgi:hypothetical protein
MMRRYSQTIGLVKSQLNPILPFCRFNLNFNLNLNLNFTHARLYIF